MTEDMKDDMDFDSEFIRYRRLRNREMHYRRALLEREENKNKKFKLILVGIMSVLIGAMASLSTVALESDRYLEKKTMLDDLSAIILNEGDLRAVKQAFLNQRPAVGFELLFSSKEDYYEKGVALSTVLNDLRVSAFRSNEKEILAPLDTIIDEHEETNPFDKLQTGQKDYFENIRIKSKEQYDDIANDVNNIAEELHNKNELVEEYLSDSTMSFWISIIALLISVSIGGYQIFTSRPEAMRKFLITLLDESSVSDEKPGKPKQEGAQ